MSTVADPIPFLPRSRRGPRFTGGWVGMVILTAVVLPCILTLPWSAQRYDQQRVSDANDWRNRPPGWSEPLGTDRLGRSLLWRCLLGGAISLGIGAAAAGISVAIGVTWGAVAGYAGGRTDAAMMRIVDILYGLPYILLVVLVRLAMEAAFKPGEGASEGGGVMRGVVTLLIAIGSVSWLTMARVIRGQVLSLRSQPFVEAARACGVGPVRILCVHLLPNLVGPIVVYATLTVPAAILQESFLSFLGIGVQAPLPSWGSLASDGLEVLHSVGRPGMVVRWWLLLWPCALLGLTLMALNFLGDALRAKLDPRSRGR